jgi:hypothetical protein
VEDAAILEALLREKQAKTAMEKIGRAVEADREQDSDDDRWFNFEEHSFTPEKIAERTKDLWFLWTSPFTIGNDFVSSQILFSTFIILRIELI